MKYHSIILADVQHLNGSNSSTDEDIAFHLLVVVICLVFLIYFIIQNTV